MEWIVSKAGTKNTPAWDSECGNYRVCDCSFSSRDKPFRLVSFVHDDEEGNVKFWDFDTLEEAKDYAEYI